MFDPTTSSWRLDLPSTDPVFLDLLQQRLMRGLRADGCTRIRFDSHVLRWTRQPLATRGHGGEATLLVSESGARLIVVVRMRALFLAVSAINAVGIVIALAPLPSHMLYVPVGLAVVLPAIWAWYVLARNRTAAHVRDLVARCVRGAAYDCRLD